jgi:hypothetical protein
VRADHGPTGEGEPRIGAFGELNIVEKGKNYGWPRVVGAPGLPDYTDQFLSWIPFVPPEDMVFRGNDLYVSALSSRTDASTLRSSRWTGIDISRRGNSNVDQRHTSIRYRVKLCYSCLSHGS